MNEKITLILAQMATLEDDLRTAVHEQETKIFFQVRGKRVQFEQSVKAAHRKLKQNFFHWLVTNRPQNLITGPIIYAMLFPLMMLDFFVSLYQFTCFPIYGINRVRRANYIVFDRQHLAYLNFIEKFHCTYCAYGSGLKVTWARSSPVPKSIFAPLNMHTESLAPTSATTASWTTATQRTMKPGWRDFGRHWARASRRYKLTGQIHRTGSTSRPKTHDLAGSGVRKGLKGCSIIDMASSSAKPRTPAPITVNAID